MRYATVCSGISAESAAWVPLGWEPVWYSEIAKFPSAVLAHHYPNTPNLGDMTKIHEDERFKESIGTIDLISGGTPCQSFSVAGLRKGMADPRGNLALTYLGIVDKLRPRWVVWENVPGVLSSSGGQDLRAILNGFEELGYVIEIDILDAQFFGVPQRRKRVFICAQSREGLLAKTTTSSSLTIAKCLLEILHCILIDQSIKFGRGRIKSEQAYLSKDGAKKRMKLFEIATEKCNYKRLRQILIEAFQKFQPEVRSWGLVPGEKKVGGFTLEDLLMGSPADHQFLLTEGSLKIILDEAYQVMRLYTTLTSIKKITDSQIYTCLKAGLIIGRLICRLSGSSPVSLSAVSSFLMYLKDCTSYAKQANRELFSQLDGVYSWGDFIAEAEYTNEFVGHLGGWRRAAAVLFEPESLLRHSTPGREAGQRVAGSLSSRASGGGGLGTEFECGGGVVAPTLQSGGKAAGSCTQQDAENGALITYAYQNPSNPLQKSEASPTLRSRGGLTDERNAPALIVPPLKAHSAKTGKGDGAPLFFQSKASASNSMNPGGIAPSIDASKSDGLAVFTQNTRDEVRYVGGDGQTAGALGAETGSKQQNYLHARSRVRRLTVTECERLQGFPDGYTDVPGWKSNNPKKYGGNGTPDGPRYKALGNSMSKPVVQWIGQRILAVVREHFETQK